MLAPFGYRVIIKPDAADEVTSGGLIVPETARDREQHGIQTGILFQKGPNVGYGLEDVEIGSSVVIKRYSGSKITDPDTGTDYLIVIDEDVVAWDKPEPATADADPLEVPNFSVKIDGDGVVTELMVEGE